MKKGKEQGLWERN